jgi:hypothetical protein
MLDQLASTFRSFAGECHGASPIYEGLSLAVAGDRELLEAIEPAVGSRFNANLLFAAARYLSLKEGREVPESPASFREFCLDRLEGIRELLSSRVTQTNEVARCSYLLLGFELIRRELVRPLALLEVGASAGLNLLFDRYLYHYGDHGTLGPDDSAVVLSPRVMAGVPPVPDTMPPVLWRLGIDIRPLSPRDPDDRLWLMACVWPEHQERQQRLERALDLAAQSPPPIVAGNAADVLAEAASGAPREATLVVFHTNTLGYLSLDERQRLTAQIADLGDRRDSFRLSGEGPSLAHGFEAALRLSRLPARAGNERVLANILQHARGFAWTADG